MDDKIHSLRDALEWLDRDINEEAATNGEMSNANAIRVGFIRNMLSRSPLRNCDVGTAEEQRARFDKFCRSNSWDEIDGAHCMSSCPLYHGDCSRCEELEWAQMPYEEGGGK